jgi:hypothetical protein
MLDTLILDVACEPPWKLVASGMHLHNHEFQGQDLFEALVALRTELEKNNARLLCSGARVAVFPSGMSKSMGGGRKAYITTLGASATEMVDIFDPTEFELTGTVSQQQEFHNRWIQSLVK